MQAGITSGNLASAAVGATNVVGTLIATSLIERAGRKQLLTQSYVGMALAMLTMAAGFGLHQLAAYSGTIALVGTLFYILSFAIGAGPVTGLLVPEINSARVRGRGVAVHCVSGLYAACLWASLPCKQLPSAYSIKGVVSQQCIVISGRMMDG